VSNEASNSIAEWRAPFRSTTTTSEAYLARRIVSCIRSGRTPWGELAYVKEFYYGVGRTDFVARDSAKSLIALEAKVERWRVAVRQAYRNRSFAHRSYVVLPPATAEKALRASTVFDEHGVGLCVLSRDELRVLINAQHCDPIQPWLAARAGRVIDGSSVKI
jgi:hypothetical protein